VSFSLAGVSLLKNVSQFFVISAVAAEFDVPGGDPEGVGVVGLDAVGCDVGLADV
jgi:hypothetical protein